MPSDLTRGLLPPVDNVLCLAVPILRKAVESDERLGLYAIAYSVTIPILYRLNHLAISPNFANVAFNAFLPLLATLFTPVLGMGIVATALVVPIYSFGMLLQSWVRLAAHVALESVGLMLILGYPCHRKRWRRLLLNPSPRAPSTQATFLSSRLSLYYSSLTRLSRA